MVRFFNSQETPYDPDSLLGRVRRTSLWYNNCIMQYYKRYWLRGSGIGLVILLSLILTIDSEISKSFLKPAYSFSYLLFRNVLHCGNENMLCSGFTVFFSFFLIFIALGGFLGWLYGKKRKK
jgi:hypothetical protein